MRKSEHKIRRNHRSQPRSPLKPHIASQVRYYDDSVMIGTEILTMLFALRSLPVTAESVAAAAEKAITVTGLRLYWTWLGRAKAT